MKRFFLSPSPSHTLVPWWSLCALFLGGCATLRESMCTAVVPGVGSGWEVNIARLIDQANETLSSSAYLRRANGERSSPPRISRRSTVRTSSPLRSAVPATFRGDRGASYRRGSEGWDASVFGRERGGDSVVCERFPPSPPAPYSSAVTARVEGAKLDGMEDRIKLEVQTNVNQRLSQSERAAEAVGQRVDSLAEEVANLGEIVRKSNASTATALEQLLAGEQRNRSAVTLLETWRSDREGWFARTGDSLVSLTEDSRALARRTHTQQKVLDEAVIAQEDLAASVKSARKVGEASSASAMAPIREHFLKEIESIRRRLLALESEAQQTTTTGGAVPDVTPTQFRSIAQEEASEKADEVWRKMKAKLRENGSEEAKERADGAVAAINRLESRLAEVEQRVSNHGFTIETLHKADRETLKEPPRESPPARDAMKALEKKLADGLARIDNELRESQQVAAAANAQMAKSISGAAVGKEDVKPILKRIEELERLRDRPPADLVPAAAAAPPPLLSVDKLESVAAAVKELASGAGGLSRRQATLENSLEEVGETLNGHKLKLRCLEGLWRQAESNKTGETVTGGAKSGDRSSSSSRSGCTGASGVPLDVGVPARAEEEGGPPASTAPALRAGFSGLLKRLGSNPLSASQKETQVGGKKESGDGGSGGVDGPGTPGPPGSTKPEELLVPRSQPPETNTRVGAGGDASALEAAPSEARPGSGGVEPGVGGTRLAEAASDGHREPHAEPRKASTSDLERREQGGAGGEGRGVTLQKAEKIGADRVGETTPLPGVKPGEKQNKSSQLQQQQQQQQPRAGREADGLDLIPQVTAQADESPAGEASATAISTAAPAAAIVQTAAAAVAAAAGPVAEQRAARELEESGGSLEGDSVHSRWSLPDNRGIGGIGAAGGLHEQRAVWAGGQEDDDSVATADQAPSSVGSEGGDREKGGKSPSRSRVESYDLQQEPGDDYMVPFSPDRPSAASAAPAKSGPEDPTSGPPGVTAVTSEIEHVSATSAEVGEANTATTTGPTGTTASASGVPSVAGSGGGGGGASGSGMKEFDFSDDDDDTEGEELRDKEQETVKQPKGDSGSSGIVGGGQAESEQGGSNNTAGAVAGGGANSIAESAGVGGREEEGKKQARSRRRGKQRPKGGDDGDASDDLSSGSDNRGGTVSTAEQKRRQDHLGLPHGGGSDGSSTPPTGGKRGIVDSACATPAPGAWAPDFGFSSDDDFDIEFSASSLDRSERSLERSVERSRSRSPRVEEEEASK